jgi:phage repressor protein C with HTH and peptisase S24 domain
LRDFVRIVKSISRANHQLYASIVRLHCARKEADNPQMASIIQKNLQDLIAERGVSPEFVSKQAGLDRGYLRTLFERPNASPRSQTLQQLADALGVPITRLLEGAPQRLQDISTHPAQSLQNPPQRVPARSAMPTDVPVVGTAAGSHLKGAFQLTSDPVDFVRRPPALLGAKDVYALFVEGSSMEPQYFPGELIYVHPHKPPRFGDAIVIQCLDGEAGMMEATIGIFSKRTERHITIRKHNPPADVQILRETVVAIHKVLTTNELFGV